MGILLVMGMPTPFLYRHKHCLASVLNKKQKTISLCVLQLVVLCL